MPLLRIYRCLTCNRRFVLGGRPPFAYCPKCANTKLEPARSGRVRKGFSHPTLVKNLLLSLLRAHAYRCPDCRRYFLDRRPLAPVNSS